MDRAEAERVIREAVVSGEKGARAALAASGSVPGQRAVSH
jgi:hypothetical protein